MTQIAQNALEALKACVDDKGWTDNPDDLAPHLSEWRDRYRGQTPLMLRPKTTEAVAAIVRTANRHGVKLAVQGGNTGLVYGGVPAKDGSEVLVSLGRLNRIRSVDAEDFSLIAEAGVTLAGVQQAAADADRLFPLSLGAEGTATAGGVVSTNAGGVHVLKYGTARALTLGLEAVLPTGEVLNGLSTLRKDNTGYDLTSLLAGAEGTLGIVTAVAFQLFPALNSREVCLAGIPDPQAAIQLLARLRAATGDRVIAFELIGRYGLELVTRHIPDTRDPLESPHPWYVLIELASSEAGADLRGGLEAGLAAAMEDDLVQDAVIASSQDQAGMLWHMRHALSEAQKPEGAAIKHDISMPVTAIPAFLERALPAVADAVPGLRPVVFGHVGDGNLHFDLLQPEDADAAGYLARSGEVHGIVHDILHDMGGSISAEHGIGRMKASELARLKDPAALAAMRAIKTALDPKGILNPGRILG